MLRKFTRKPSIAVLGALALLAVAGAAVAYFTAGGSGSGSATVGRIPSSDIVIKGDMASGQYLFPGGAVTVPITVQNHSNSAVNVGAVALTNIAASGTATAAQCDVSAFTMDPVAVDQAMPAGGTSTEVDGSLKMNDTVKPSKDCRRFR